MASSTLLDSPAHYTRAGAAAVSNNMDVWLICTCVRWGGYLQGSGPAGGDEEVFDDPEQKAFYTSLPDIK
jgi:hypothetical protein